MTALPRRARSVVITTGIVGLVALLTPIWFVHDRVSRLLANRRRARLRAIPRASAHAIDLDALLRSRTPVIVEGLTDQLDIGDAATPASLRRVAGAAQVDIAYHDDAAPFFLYSGGYGATVVARKQMAVDDFIDMMFDVGPDPGTVVYQLFGPRSVDGRVAAELDRFDKALAPHVDHPTAPQFSGVWIGSTGVVTPLHHDAWPGLLFQTHGRKRVAMYAPRDRANLSFRSPLIGAGRWSDLPARSADADVEEFPALDHTHRYEADLAPGDTLFIPPFWAHEMEALEPNISVPFRFTTFRRSYLNPGFLRPACEIARARIAA